MIDAEKVYRLLVLAWAVGLIAAGCDRSDNGNGDNEYDESGELVFEEDFEGDRLGPAWERGQGEDGSGEWEIVDGKLRGVDIKNDPLWLTEKLPEEVRVEFDAEARSPVGDIKVEVFGDGKTHESGYILIFGGWENSLDVIARLDEHGEDRKERETHGVVPGHTYEMAVQRTDDTLEWFVDGERFMTYEDDEALRGEEHRYFAFNVWAAPVHFDNVRVYDLSK
ncbi:MAG: hypothetical protein ACOCV2_09210 [Persicimonas sp.]